MNNINLKVLRRHIQVIFFAHIKCQKEALCDFWDVSLVGSGEGRGKRFRTRRWYHHLPVVRHTQRQLMNKSSREEIRQLKQTVTSALFHFKSPQSVWTSSFGERKEEFGGD